MVNRRLALVGLQAAILSLGLFVAVEGQNASQPIIGNGWGLDHVMIGQKSFEALKKIFDTQLGFTLRRGTKFPSDGLENSIIPLPPAYIELLWVYGPAVEPGDAQSKEIRRKAAEGEVIGYNIDVSPIQRAADLLGRLGLTITLPPSITRLVDGKEEPGPWQFLDISSEQSARPPLGVPGAYDVGFLEYRNHFVDKSQSILLQLFETTRLTV